MAFWRLLFDLSALIRSDRYALTYAFTECIMFAARVLSIYQ